MFRSRSLSIVAAVGVVFPLPNWSALPFSGNCYTNLEMGIFSNKTSREIDAALPIQLLFNAFKMGGTLIYESGISRSLTTIYFLN